MYTQFTDLTITYSNYVAYGYTTTVYVYFRPSGRTLQNIGIFLFRINSEYTAINIDVCKHGVPKQKS